MPVDFMKRPAGQGGGSGNAQGNANPKVVVNPDISGVNFGRIADQANQTYDPEMAKYYAAVDLARQKFSGNEDANEKMFRKEIDDIYKNELGGTLNPDTDIRGNNALTQAIRGLNEGYDDALTIAGNVIDKPWDYIAGGIADATGQHKAADKLRNLMDGRDVGTALDIGADIALMSNPMTMPIGIAKALVQQSDNIDEAIKGRDNVTLDDLTGAQRAARGGEAALNTALATLPGVGKAGKLLKAAKADEVAKSLKGAEETAKPIQSSLDSFAKGNFDDISDEGLKNAALKADKASSDLASAQSEYDAKLANLVTERDAATAKLKEAIQNVGSGNGKMSEVRNARQAQREVNDKIDALYSDAEVLGGEMSASREAMEEAQAARKALQEEAKPVTDRINRLTDLGNASYPVRVARMANDQSRAMRNAIKNIPEVRREIAKAQGNLPAAFSAEGLDDISRLPRTRFGMRKLMNEEGGYKRFGIDDETAEKMTDSEKRQFADQTAALIREQIGRTPTVGALRNAMNQIGDATRAENFSEGLLRESQEDLLKKLKADEKIKGTPTEKLKNIRNMIASSLAGVSTLGAQGALAGMATGDYDNLQQGVMATFNNLERHPWKFVPGLFPIGAKRASLRMNPGLRGNMGSSIPFHAARGAGIGNYITSQTEPDTSGATNEEEILRRLAALKAGE